MQAFRRSSSDGSMAFSAMTPSKSTVPETGIKAHNAEAVRLYQRGVAAARGGQRRVAAGLLTRSLQLDPANEQGWLWLSGVLDDPHQIAFCLQSVLNLNPANERAQKGLRWLEERNLLQTTPKPASALPDLPVLEHAVQNEARTYSESWWVNWRQTRREMNRIRLLFWSIPLVLLCLAMVLHHTFSLAVEQSRTPPTLPPVLSSAVRSEAEPLVIDEPVFDEELAAVREVRTISYLSTLEPLRQQLRTAVNNYRTATLQTGGASVTHVTAAQRLRSQVERAYVTLKEVTPPPELSNAHDDYVRGLALELEALDAILDFYSTFKVERANESAIRFQEAGLYFDRARIVFDAYTIGGGLISSVSAYNPR